MVEAILLAFFWTSLGSFFSGIETGAYSVNRTRLRLRMAQPRPRHPGTESTCKLLENMQALICLSLIGNNIVNYMASSVTTRYFESLYPAMNTEFLATFLLAPFIFIWGETVPKNIFRNRADTLMYRLSSFILFLRFLFYPLIRILEILIYWTTMNKKKEKEVHANADLLGNQLIDQLLLAGQQEGVLTKRQAKLAQDILRLDDLHLEDIMLPMAQVTTLSLPVSPDDLLMKTKETGFSRFPVHDSENAIQGMVDVYDILYASKPEIVPIRKIWKLSAKSTLREAIGSAEVASEKMALAIDEKGIPVGILTTKYLLRHLVQNQRDRHFEI